MYEEQGLPVTLHVEPDAGHGWLPTSDEERRVVLRFLAKHLRHEVPQ